MSVCDRLRRSLAVALFIATCYALLAGLLATVTKGAVLEYFGVGLPTVLATYFGSGVVVGLLTGFLAPLINTRFRAALAGLLVAMPVFLAVNLVMTTPGEWFSLESVVKVLVSSALLGPFIGVRIWRTFG